MDNTQDNVIEFPLKAPNQLCNHRLSRQAGYCKNASGAGTEHKGHGRCKVHETGRDGNTQELFAMLGLSDMIAVAEMMTADDQEYAYLMSNNFLVLQRAKIIKSMDQVMLSSKERKEMIDSVEKIDKILAKHTIEIKGEGEAAVTDEDAAEMKRLEELGA